MMGVVLMGVMAFGVWGFVWEKFMTRYRATKRLHLEIQREMEFIQEQHDRLIAKANRCIDMDRWNAYQKVKKQLENLDRRWEREVTRKLNHR